MKTFKQIREATKKDEGYVSAAQRKAVWASRADGGEGHPDKKKSKKEDVDEVVERISGSGTDRKAQLKRAFRAGQHKTDMYYGDRGRTRSIPTPKGMRGKGDYMSKHKDKGIEKAYNKGKHDDDRINPPKGKEKMKPQDTLRSRQSMAIKKDRQRVAAPAGKLPK